MVLSALQSRLNERPSRTIAAVLRSTWDCSRSLLANLLLGLLIRATCVYVDGLRRLSYVSVHMGTCRNELALTLVPRSEYFVRWGAAQDARVNEA